MSVLYTEVLAPLQKSIWMLKYFHVLYFVYVLPSILILTLIFINFVTQQ